MLNLRYNQVKQKNMWYWVVWLKPPAKIPSHSRCFCGAVSLVSSRKMQIDGCNGLIDGWLEISCQQRFELLLFDGVLIVSVALQRSYLIRVYLWLPLTSVLPTSLGTSICLFYQSLADVGYVVNVANPGPGTKINDHRVFGRFMCCPYRIKCYFSSEITMFSVLWIHHLSQKPWRQSPVEPHWIYIIDNLCIFIAVGQFFWGTRWYI